MTSSSNDAVRMLRKSLRLQVSLGRRVPCNRYIQLVLLQHSQYGVAPVNSQFELDAGPLLRKCHQ